MTRTDYSELELCVEILVLSWTTHLRQTIRLPPDGFRHISILGDCVEVPRANARQYLHRRGHRRAWIARQVVNDRIRTCPRPVHADQAQYFIGGLTHRG